MESWYIVLSRVSAGLSGPLNALADQVNVPMVSVFLFGVLGAAAPCQLTTNLSAMAFVSRQTGSETTPLRLAVAYTTGKAVVYTVIGGLLIFLGLRLDTATVPVVVAARRILGPLLIVMGLILLGVIRWRFEAGRRLRRWLEARLPQEGSVGAFLMGLAFSVAFCPTLFWLFFGLTIPLGLRSPVGWSYPALFAVGTATPLLALAGVATLGGRALAGSKARVARVGRVANRIAGIVFILAGINDTLTYWTL
ncbi:MAG: sulfite exporter TauE/SafE family protein [candidate division NC10 bacterium]|nr:sulfite exporter TauE/SafE family protein [candidate division NC10 bacterium]